MPLSVTLSQYSAILPIVVFLLLLKKIKDWHLWVIFFYCVLSFSNDTILIYRDNRGLRIREFLYSFTIIEYLIFAAYLVSILTNKLVKKILLILSTLFTIFCLYIIIGESLKKFDSVQSSISAIILISFCIIYYFEQINQPQFTFIYSSYHFWIITAALFYLCSTLFLFTFAIRLPQQELDYYWIINHISSILKNILFSVAVLIYVRTPKTPKIQKPNEYDYQPYLN